jgi:selenocysteine lyase/cysteine desulfurase
MAAVLGHLRLEEEIGGYEAEAAEAPAIRHSYQAIATLLGCGADEIALVENATRAWDMAFYALEFGPGDRILTARSEYVSNMLALLGCRAVPESGSRLWRMTSTASFQWMI